jgi:hypothetical protein
MAAANAAKSLPERANVVMTKGQFPYLDVLPNATTQDFANLIISQDKTTISSFDQPATGSPDNAQTGIADDLAMGFRLYLEWKWTQAVGGTNVSIYYTLAYQDWSVNFYGTGLGPINTVRILDGVSAGGLYIQSNIDPACMDLNNGYNANNQWKAI